MSRLYTWLVGGASALALNAAAAQAQPQAQTNLSSQAQTNTPAAQPVAPPGGPARPAFARLRAIAESVRSVHPGATDISAGMSGDLEEAVAEGATLVRIGTALLGGRRAFVR